MRDEQGRTVLITGVTGQDGIYLARFLRARGARVVGAAPAAASPPELCAAYLGDVEVVPLDICDGEQVQRVIDTIRPDEVYNLAAVSSVARSWDEPEATFAVNHTAVETLVRALLELRGRTGHEPRFFQASSAEVTGSAAHSPYAQAKAAAEEVVREARDRDGLHACFGPALQPREPAPHHGVRHRQDHPRRRRDRRRAAHRAAARQPRRQPRLGLRRRLRRRDVPDGRRRRARRTSRSAPVRRTGCPTCCRWRSRRSASTTPRRTSSRTRT